MPTRRVDALKPEAGLHPAYVAVHPPYETLPWIIDGNVGRVPTRRVDAFNPEAGSHPAYLIAGIHRTEAGLHSACVAFHQVTSKS